MSLSIIHFSDIHIVDRNDSFFEKVEKIKIACAGAVPQDSNVIINISGDIAYSGKIEQYNLANNVFDDIVDYIEREKNAKVEIVMVPGNHDCNFDVDTHVRQVLINSIKNESIDNNYYELVVGVQNEYMNFAGKYDIDATSIFETKSIIVNNERILFVMLNTAWMSIIEEYPGRIYMPDSLFGSINPEEYKVVIYTYHHPDNWLNPDSIQGFIGHIRQNADMILVGHEHKRDDYEKIGTKFSMFCSHGKELQDNKSDNSAFSVINFDDLFQTFEVLDYVWNGEMYNRISVSEHQYHKNIAASNNIFSPNKEIVEFCNDVGIAINHFSKENVTLSDIFVWPDINKCNYYNEDTRVKYVRSDVYKEISENDFNVMIAGDSGCKTAFAKKLFFMEMNNDICCLLIDGKEFTSSDENNIKDVIENSVKKQYSSDIVEYFRQLPKDKRMIIIDDFDQIKINNNRRNSVLNYICDYFGRVTILLSSSMDLTSILSCNKFNSAESVYYYEILPLGNRKRKELISKWYGLASEYYPEEEIAKRVEYACSQIDTILGNGAAFIPAMPVFIISALQNIDAKKNVYDGSKYGSLYESLIMCSLAKISRDYTTSNEYRVDINIMSKLAFNMLYDKKHFLMKMI